MTGMITLSPDQLPTTEIAANYDSLSKSFEFLGRVQLYTKGKAIDKGLIAPGHYGIFISDSEIQDLGTSIDVIPLARRPKAMDFNDKEHIITVYDENSLEFKRIQAASNLPDSGCMFGVSFLVYERTTGRFLELFLGTKSTRPEAKNIYPFLPRVEDGKTVGPFPITLKSKYVEKKYSYYAPVVTKCSTPFTNLPPTEKIVAEIRKFVNPTAENVEVAPAEKRRAR